MSKSNNTVRSTESKAIYTHAEEKASNQMRPVGKKVERSAETAPWVGDDCILDHAFVADMTEEAPNDMQNRLRNEAGAEFIDREAEERKEASRIPAEWLSALTSTTTVVRGYMSTPREGEHKVRLVYNDEYPKFFASTERYKAFMVLLLEDVRTHKRWEASVKLEALDGFKQNVANENNGLGVGETAEELLTTLTKKDFRCWTLIDPEKVEKYQNRTFFSSAKYTQVYNAIQKKMETAKKREADKQ